jgi:uncharacterized protein (UPF0297 family)
MIFHVVKNVYQISIIRQLSSLLYDIIQKRGEECVLNRGFYVEIKEIVHSIQEAGYDPYLQLSGFVQTGDERYITRNNDARRRIVELDWNLLEAYISEMKSEKRHP